MRSILRQSSWLIVAQILTRIISFIYSIFLARVLGVEGFGIITVAIAYFAIVSSISDLGFNRFLIREVVREKGKLDDLLWNLVFLRLTITSIIFAVFSLVLYSFDPDKFRVNVILLATLAIIPSSIAITFDGIFIALQKLQYSAISILLSYMTTSLLGLYLVSNNFGPAGAAGAIVIGQILYTLVLLVFLQRQKLLSSSKLSLPLMKNAIMCSIPYGLIGVLGLIYFRIDSVLLSYLRGSYETGLYGAGYRFLESIIFIPSAFGFALFPSMVKLHDSDKQQLKSVYFKSLKLLGLFGLGIFLFYFFILPEIIKILLPDYRESLEVIKILAFSIPFIFLATPGVQVLLSSEKYLKTVIGLSIFTVAFNITLNLAFIPKYGLLAASWITVLSDVLSFVIFYKFIRRKILT